MSDTSGIEWTDATWNPVVGCEHVSPGCDNCYAAREASGRLAHLPAYAGLASGGKFTGEVRLLPDRLDQPKRWRKPRMIFVNSMSDLFHKDVPDEYIARVWQVMAGTPQHTYQVLTKRPARMRAWVNRCSNADGSGYITHNGLRPGPAAELDTTKHGIIVGYQQTSHYEKGAHRPYRIDQTWPLPNVWLGVSAEDQHWADIRIPQLLETPAAVRFVSAEPLLGPIDLTGLTCPGCGGKGGASGYSPLHGVDMDADCGLCDGRGRSPGLLDWLIAGGESGPGARPMHPDWARSLRDQCESAEVPYLFKQWGEWAPTGYVGAGGHDPREIFVRDSTVTCHDFEGAQLRKVGKKAAGRELDGRTWDEYPQRAEVSAA